MEGGEDEELDYDVNDDFQDDEDNNNFHRNEEEEEEQKRIEVGACRHCEVLSDGRNNNARNSRLPMRLLATGLRSKTTMTARTMTSLATSSTRRARG